MPLMMGDAGVGTVIAGGGDAFAGYGVYDTTLPFLTCHLCNFLPLRWDLECRFVSVPADGRCPTTPLCRYVCWMLPSALPFAVT